MYTSSSEEGNAVAVVDLRSDTVTRPSAAMRRAMAEAEVGDDVYGEDPTVNRLQERAAAIFGCEAALFVPSGSIKSQVSIPSGAVVVRGMHPAMADMEASSYWLTCARCSQITSIPGCVHVLMAMRLPIEPLGTNSAASQPKISAARSCKRLTVGSSP